MIAIVKLDTHSERLVSSNSINCECYGDLREVPGCCKLDNDLSVIAVVDFLRELGVKGILPRKEYARKTFTLSVRYKLYELVIAATSLSFSRCKRVERPVIIR